VSWRGLKKGLLVVALLVPGGILLLAGWVLLRALARATVRLREETRSAGEPSGMWQVWQVVSSLSVRDLLREARGAL
jgi:hypothetical protein